MGKPITVSLLRDLESQVSKGEISYSRMAEILNEQATKPEMGVEARILEEYGKGNIVFADEEGIQIMPMSEFLKQPVDGMLYDLNRSEEAVLTFLPDPKWINDYAVAKTIRELDRQITQMKAGTEMDSLESKDYIGSVKEATTNLKAENQRLNNLADAQEEYLKLLGAELDDTVGMASIHGWKSARHEAGKIAREKIEQWKQMGQENEALIRQAEHDQDIRTIQIESTINILELIEKEKDNFSNIHLAGDIDKHISWLKYIVSSENKPKSAKLPSKGSVKLEAIARSENHPFTERESDVFRTGFMDCYAWIVKY